MVDNKYPVTTVVTVNSCYIFYCIQYIYNVHIVDIRRKVKEKWKIYDIKNYRICHMYLSNVNLNYVNFYVYT